jgi:DNA-binding transcriptional MerR regulator
LLSIAGDADRECITVDAIASEHLQEVDRKIADLSALRRELADALERCEGGSVADCRILEVFSARA